VTRVFPAQAKSMRSFEKHFIVLRDIIAQSANLGTGKFLWGNGNGLGNIIHLQLDTLENLHRGVWLHSGKIT
jgi:hypothetical protein